MKAAKCGNAARPGLRKCYNKFIERELSIANVTNTRRMIPMLCCEFNKLRECFKAEAEEVKICTRRTIDFVERYALEMFGEILNIMCYEYQDSSDRCDKVTREIPQLDFDGVKKPRSFIPPMLDILKLIGDDF
ncbi:unnamed protein product [Medioppia subpectinata]|uniref:Uncharacterized protein n=1 Tax=Medioppia subpectinata TaxID=1979941 RepID=A0A7R9LN69_9ACAR|nr:unnamed protein product [Medioppia subpectinata]CAG2120260.1 unnamed protein product [Medioppia subpectinata]